VIVCDNASSDGPMEKIEDWASGRITASCDSPDLTRLVLPSIPKPVAFVSIDASEASTKRRSPDDRLVLIERGANLGFAGGNNVGIRYALDRCDCDYVWLLNNDTVVEPDSHSAIMRMAEADPKLGICGSQLRSYAFPHEIQTMGGKKVQSLERAHTASAGTHHAAGFDDSWRARLCGGGLYADKPQVSGGGGSARRELFLYYEELDLAARVRPAFQLGYSPESVVYDKEGASIGSAHVRSNRSVLSDYYQARNRIVFSRRHHPWFLHPF